MPSQRRARAGSLRLRSTSVTTSGRLRRTVPASRLRALLAFCFSLFHLAGQAAAAGWLVIATTSPSVPPGTLVEDPATLVVEEGASVTLLAEDGRLVTRRHREGAVEQSVTVPAAADRLAGALRALVAGGRTGTHIGAVRSAGEAFSGGGPGCGHPTASVEELAQAGCRKEVAERLSRLVAADLARDLYIYAAGREEPHYRYGEPIDLHAVANFEALLLCWIEQDGTVERLLPRGDRPPPRLQPSRPQALFAEKGPRPVAAPPPGRSRVRCLGFDTAYGRKLARLLEGRPAAAEELQRLSHAWLAGTLEGAAADITIEVAEATASTSGERTP